MRSMTARSPIVRLAVLGLLVALALARPAPAAAQAAEEATRLLNFDVSTRWLGVEFETIRSFKLYGESGDFRGQYVAAKSLAWNGGVSWRRGRRRLGGYLGAGIDVSYVNRAMVVPLDARVPHPYILSFPREIYTSVRGLKRNEIGLNLQGQYWRVFFGRLLLRGFAGPTIFIARQEIINRIQTAETEVDFDQVFLTDYQTTGAIATKVGYNIGFDSTWFLNDRVGLGGAVRYARASITSHVRPSIAVPFALGGLNVGGGLRWKF